MDMGYDSRLYAECAAREAVAVIPLRRNSGLRESSAHVTRALCRKRGDPDALKRNPASATPRRDSDGGEECSDRTPNRGSVNPGTTSPLHSGHIPNSTKDPVGYGANRRQSAAWMRENEEIVIPRLRPLRYPHDYPDERPEEKGIDVQLALAAVEHAISEPPLCEVAIIFSHDTDLVPAIQTISRLKGAAHVETASWTSEIFSARLRASGHRVFHHELDRNAYEAVRDAVNYARRG